MPFKFKTRFELKKEVLEEENIINAEALTHTKIAIENKIKDAISEHRMSIHIKESDTGYFAIVLRNPKLLDELKKELKASRYGTRDGEIKHEEGFLWWKRTYYEKYLIITFL